MPKFKTLVLGILALGLFAVGAQAEQATQSVAPSNATLTLAATVEAPSPLEVDENCPIHGVHAKLATDLAFDATFETALMSSEDVPKDSQGEASCYITGSNCESCSGNKIRACTFRRCYCSCSGTWYTTKDCTACANYC